jgi:hypothetical protein
MVAWLDQARMSGSFAFAASRMLNADGFPGTTVLFGAAMRDSRISVASRGNEHLVVWESPEGDILGTRVSATGTKLDANPIVVSRGARGWSPAVTTDGVDYQVVWNQPETLPIICVMTCPQVASLQGALVSGSGALAAQVKIAAARIFPSNPAVVWNGSEFAVFWSGAGIASEISVDAWRISRVGLPLEGPVKVGRVASVDGAASSAGGYLVALTDRATSAATLVRLDANFVRVDDIVLSDRQTPAAPNAMSVAILPQQDGSTLIAHRTISDEVSRAVGSLVAPSASPAQSGGRRRSVRGG